MPIKIQTNFKFFRFLEQKVQSNVAIVSLASIEARFLIITFIISGNVQKTSKMILRIMDETHQNLISKKLATPVVAKHFSGISLTWHKCQVNKCKKKLTITKNLFVFSLQTPPFKQLVDGQGEPWPDYDACFRGSVVKIINTLAVREGASKGFTQIPKLEQCNRFVWTPGAMSIPKIRWSALCTAILLFTGQLSSPRVPFSHFG